MTMALTSFYLLSSSDFRSSCHDKKNDDKGSHASVVPEDHLKYLMPCKSELEVLGFNGMELITPLPQAGTP